MAAAAPEALSGTAGKLKVLFGIPEDSGALLVGPRALDVVTGARSVFREVLEVGEPGALERAAAGGPFDFACVDLQSGWVRGAVRGLAQYLDRHLAACGVVLLLLPCTRSVHRIRGRIRRALAGRWSGGQTVWRELVRAGFHAGAEYVVTPNLASPESFVRIPFDWSVHGTSPRAIHAWAARRGWYGLMFPDMVRVACRGTDRPRSGLEACLAEALAAVDTEGGVPEIESFAPRPRGALTATVRSRATGHRFFARVSTDERATTILDMNRVGVDALHATGDGEIRRLVPAVRHTLVRGGLRVYVEDHLAGIIGWRVCSVPGAEATLLGDATGFLARLGSATRRPVRLDRDLFRASTRALCEAFDGHPASQQAVVSVEGHVQRWAEDRVISVVLGHGDYGYGNLLCTWDGRLTGVIDWDTHVREELPGVDLCHMWLQRERILRGAPLDTAFERVLGSIEAAGPIADSARRYELERFGLSPSSFPVLLCIAAVRYMARAARYPKEFASERDVYARLLQAVARTIQSHTGTSG